MSITIRRLKMSDHFALFPLYANPQITWPAGLKPFANQKDFDTIMPELILNNYAIILEKHIIGVIGCDDLGHHCGSLSFLLEQKYWHQGIMSEAIHCYLKQLKKDGYQTIYADCLTHNPASSRVLEKNGFRYLQDFYREFPDFPDPQLCHLYQIQL